ncbi:MAG: hypothetical protein KJO21_12435 [Verrucomicrobiae bacterium]|nr:hypothetical protein [Verrucomicrobiae bacterium]NNJ44026.1 hypothetical protein [Akkermansiaceae bacterium]
MASLTFNLKKLNTRSGNQRRGKMISSQQRKRHLLTSLKSIDVVVLFGVGALLLVCSTLVILEPSLFQRLHREDGCFEYAGCLLLLCCSVLLILQGRRELKAGLPGRWSVMSAWVLILTGSIFFIGAGEEISWGQRILGFDTPQTIKEINDQNEFNVHNMAKGFVDTSLRYSIALASMLGTLFIVIRWDSICGIRLPSLPVVQALALSGVYQNSSLIDKPYCMSAAVLVFGLFISLLSRNAPYVGMSVFSLSVAVVVMILNLKYNEQLNPNSTPEVRELIFSFVSAGWALTLVFCRQAPHAVQSIEPSPVERAFVS